MVDPLLRVRGVAGLRVADASVMPMIPNAHPNATVLAIAERAVELITGGSLRDLNSHNEYPPWAAGIGSYVCHPNGPRPGESCCPRER